MLDYTNNGITIYCHKSDRKNAKVSDVISVCHLITQSDNKQVRDILNMWTYREEAENIVERGC